MITFKLKINFDATISNNKRIGTQTLQFHKK